MAAIQALSDQESAGRYAAPAPDVVVSGRIPGHRYAQIENLH
jgi:hypothetical protein